MNSTKKRFTPCKGMRKQESVKFLLVEFGILGFGILGFGIKEFRNPTNDWNPVSKLNWQRLESSTWNPRSVAWNPGSKTVPGFPYMWRNVAREWKQQSVELTVQRVSSVKISLLATSILFHANAKFNCINWLDLFAVKIRRSFLTSS